MIGGIVKPSSKVPESVCDHAVHVSVRAPKRRPRDPLGKPGKNKLRLQQRCQDGTDASIMDHLLRKAVGTVKVA